MNNKLFEPYTDYRYLYPPRPEFVTGMSSLDIYDNGQFFAQPKLNGSCAILFLNGKGNYRLMNRHNEPLTLFNAQIEFGKLHRGNGYMVLCGEYMNKNKNDAAGKPFNHKFCIWEILVYNSELLLGTTVEERVILLNELFPCEEVRLTAEGWEHDEYLCQTDIRDIYRVPNFMDGFSGIYRKITPIDMYEGLVLKRRNAQLENCFKEQNNELWQVKCRKATQNYKR